MSTSVTQRLTSLVRRLTRWSPRLYGWLKRRSHGHRLRQERRWLQHHYPNVLMVCRSEAELAGFQSQGFRSQFGQEQLLLEQGWIPERDGTFIDIGCNHPITCSNTHYLECQRGYRGLAIDALDRFGDEWATVRPRSEFISAFVSSARQPVRFATVSGDQGWEHMLSGHENSVDLAGKAVTAQVTDLSPEPLARILATRGLDFGVDVLFMDVEGHELEVLESADWNGPCPRTIVCENTGHSREQERLRQFLMQQGYRLGARVSLFDDVFVRV